MAISGVSGSSFSIPTSQSSQQLSTSDSKKLEEILSKYDSSNMNEESLTSLKSELQSSGIRPGKAFGDTLASAGFDPGQLNPENAEGAQRGGPPGGGRGPEGAGKRPPPPQGQGGKSSESSNSISGQQLNVNILQPLSSTLQQFDLANLTDDDQQILINQLRSEGILQSGLLIDLSV